MTNAGSHLRLPRTGNRDDVVTLCEEPRESDLPRRGVVLRCNGIDRVDKLEHIGKVLFGEPREEARCYPTSTAYTAKMGFYAPRDVPTEVTLLEVIRGSL